MRAGGSDETARTADAAPEHHKGAGAGAVQDDLPDLVASRHADLAAVREHMRQPLIRTRTGFFLSRGRSVAAVPGYVE